MTIPTGRIVLLVTSPRLPAGLLTAAAWDLVRASAAANPVVGWAGGAGDEDFARRLGLRVAREPALAELELMYGSWDPPGARLLDAAAVMDRLVPPGGDPWKQQKK